MTKTASPPVTDPFVEAETEASAVAEAPEPATDPFAALEPFPVESLGKVAVVNVPPSIESIVAGALESGEARGIDLGTPEMTDDFIKFARVAAKRIGATLRVVRDSETQIRYRVSVRKASDTDDDVSEDLSD